MGKLKLNEINIKNPLIVILGPTASGKTDFSLNIYEQIDCEIISADSRQVYKYLDIGTAKPSRQILNRYKHHLIDFLEPNEEFSAGQFVKLSKEIIEKLYLNNKIPLIVGGTGLYIDALCSAFIELSESSKNNDIRAKLTNELETHGKEYLYKKLQEIDPASASKYSDMNPRRIIRALEFFYQTGIKFSDAHRELTQPTNYTVFYFGINHERDALYQRINHRTDWMWQNGLIEETKQVLQMGFSPNLNALNTVGYKEVIKYLNNLYDEHKALEEIKKNTRRYAKRQLTWFRRNQKIYWIEPKFVNNFLIYDFIINEK